MVCSRHISRRSGNSGSRWFSWYVLSYLPGCSCGFQLIRQILGLVSVFMFLYLSIYFGSYYSQVYRADHFSVELLDLDSAASPYGSVAHPAVLGPAIQSAALNSYSTDPHLGWYVANNDVVRTMRLTSDGQGRDPLSYAMERVQNQDVWAVVVVNANATSGVWNALTSGTQWTREL